MSEDKPEHDKLVKKLTAMRDGTGNLGDDNATRHHDYAVQAAIALAYMEAFNHQEFVDYQVVAKIMEGTA